MSTLKNPYRLHDIVSSGRFATVYKGVHEKNNTIHAIKRLPIKRHDVPDYQNTKMIENEIAHWSQLDSKSNYILALQDVILDEHDSHPVCFLVSPFCEGQSLKQASHKLPLTDKIRIARQLALAIYTTHQEGLIHADIKPDNCLLDTNLTLKLCDFGASVKCESLYTGGFVSWMTPNYMAPEAMTTTLGIGQTADIWAYGITIYEMLHDMKATPYNEISKSQTPWKINWPINTRHNILNPKTHQLCDIIIGCLRFNPKERMTIENILSVLQS